ERLGFVRQIQSEQGARLGLPHQLVERRRGPNLASRRHAAVEQLLERCGVATVVEPSRKQLSRSLRPVRQAAAQRRAKGSPEQGASVLQRAVEQAAGVEGLFL